MPEISDDELAKLKADAQKAKDLEASKTRLEEEKTKLKQRAQDAETKINEATKAKLEEEGKLNDLLLMERKKSTELEEKLTSRTKSVLSEKIKGAVAKHAKDAHDVDMLLRVTEHKDLLKVNEEELTVEGAEAFVGKLRDTHKFLFTGKKMPDYDNSKGKKEQDKFDKDDNELYREALKEAQTSDELAAVRKKFGKS